MTHTNALKVLIRRRDWLLRTSRPDDGYAQAELTALKVLLDRDPAQEILALRQTVKELRAEVEDHKVTARRQTQEAYVARKRLRVLEGTEAA